MKKKIFGIVNPNAGRGRLGKDWALIESQLRLASAELHVHHTKKAGDAERLAKKAIREKYDIVLSIGGDGTLNECVNGFLAESKINKKTALSVLPLGRGSDFARFIKISKNPLEAINQLLKAKVEFIDVSKVSFLTKDNKKTSRYFINMASMGASGIVVEWANKAPSMLSPLLAYFYSAVRGIIDYKPAPVKFSYPMGDLKKEVMSTLMVALVANGRYFGSGMNIAPHASLTDGLLDVSFVPVRPVLTAITKLSQLYSGDYLKNPDVFSKQVSWFEMAPVYSNDDLLLEIDGDTVGKLPVRFEVVPAALPFIGGKVH